MPCALTANLGTARKWQALMCRLCLATLVSGLFLGGRTQIAVGFVSQPWDKLLHAAVFAVLVALLAACHPRWGWQVPAQPIGRFPSRWWWLIVCTLMASAVGAADELHQLFLPGRSADLDDWAADTIGAIFGALVWSRFMQRMSTDSCCCSVNLNGTSHSRYLPS